MAILKFPGLGWRRKTKNGLTNPGMQPGQDGFDFPWVCLRGKQKRLARNYWSMESRPNKHKQVMRATSSTRESWRACVCYHVKALLLTTNIAIHRRCVSHIEMSTISAQSILQQPNNKTFSSKSVTSTRKLPANCHNTPRMPSDSLFRFNLRNAMPDKRATGLERVKDTASGPWWWWRFVTLLGRVSTLQWGYKTSRYQGWHQVSLGP